MTEAMAAAHGRLPTLRCHSPPADATVEAALDGYRAKPARLSNPISHSSDTSDTSDTRQSRASSGNHTYALSRAASEEFDSRRISSLRLPSSSPIQYRQSTGSYDSIHGQARSPRVSSANRRRGYMRPTGTDFAASARARESVLSLGSIAHLQYYFARTGLLDGKGAQLAKARKRQQKAYTLDLSALDTSSLLSPRTSGSDHDSSYASMGNSPILPAQSDMVCFAECPSEEPRALDDDDCLSDDILEPDPDMLPPTASTYHHREKKIAKPPSVAELRAELTSTLDAASGALAEAKVNRGQASEPVPDSAPCKTNPSPDPSPPHKKKPTAPGWHEIQGMHILDLVTLAIRAAKIYYTAHDQPDRLDTIKPEKELRRELLSVMDVLKRMATRAFVGGLRDDEFCIMHDWIAAVRAMLAAEAKLEEADAAERRSWSWLSPAGWEGREHAREEAFMRSILQGSPDPVAGLPLLPAWEPIDRSMPPNQNQQTPPTPFLAALQNGVRLVQLHNCAVRKSQRRFGAIGSFHADTQKPYRAADNLRYWLKAAELRWEVLLKADALAIQYHTSPHDAWIELEDAVLKWCRTVREEIAAELRDMAPAGPSSSSSSSSNSSNSPGLTVAGH